MAHLPTRPASCSHLDQDILLHPNGETKLPVLYRTAGHLINGRRYPQSPRDVLRRRPLHVFLLVAQCAFISRYISTNMVRVPLTPMKFRISGPRATRCHAHPCNQWAHQGWTHRSSTAEPRTAATAYSAAGVARHRHLKVCRAVRAARVSVKLVAGVRLVLAQDGEAVVLHAKLLVHKFVLHVNAILHVEARSTPFFSGYFSTNMVSVLPREGLEPVHEPPDIHVQMTSKLNTHEHTAVHRLIFQPPD